MATPKRKNSTIRSSKDAEEQSGIERFLRSLDQSLSSSDSEGMRPTVGGRIGSLSGGNMNQPDNRSGGGQYQGKAGTMIRGGTGVTYDDIGGMDQTIEELDLLLNGAKRYPKIWARLGKKETGHILLVGPPGTGKTTLALALATHMGRGVVLVKGAEIKGSQQGESENNLNNAYRRAVAEKCILLIDEVDGIGGKRDGMVNTSDRGIVSTLLAVLDSAGKNDGVIVIGTTNKPNMLDDALRREGRFSLEVQVLPPDEKGREQIFRIHTRGMPLAINVDIAELAKNAHGFTGADIAGVSRKLSQKVFLNAVRLIKAGASEEQILPTLIITREEFLDAIKNMVPSLLRDGYAEVASVQWEDIGGLESVKQELKRVVGWPLLYPDVIERMKLRQPKGMIMYGAPGCGKTMLAKAIATYAKSNFLLINGPAILSMWVGGSEEAVRAFFNKARLAKPCIIFCDEIDAIAPKRGQSGGQNVVGDRVLSQFLTEMDGASNSDGVFVIGATNRPDMIDPALLRPGRLDLQVEIPLPDEKAREEIMKIHLRDAPVDLKKIGMSQLVKGMEGRSGSEIEWLCTSAKIIAVQRLIDTGFKGKEEILPEDFALALEKILERKY